MALMLSIERIIFGGGAMAIGSLLPRTCAAESASLNGYLQLLSHVGHWNVTSQDRCWAVVPDSWALYCVRSQLIRGVAIRNRVSEPQFASSFAHADTFGVAVTIGPARRVPARSALAGQCRSPAAHVLPWDTHTAVQPDPSDQSGLSPCQALDAEMHRSCRRENLHFRPAPFRQHRAFSTPHDAPVKDLTKDPITLHVLSMAAPAVVIMLVQAAHHVVTLYFVSAIGTDAVAAVSAGGNALFIVAAVAQILSVGTVALVAHGAGRKDLNDINVLLNQAFGLCLVCAVVTVCVLCGLAPLYLSALSQDDAVIDLGVKWLWWVSPSFIPLFLMTILSATFRGIGIVTGPTVVLTLTILLDAAFAAVLIPGLGFIPALGVKGAGVAGTLSLAIGSILMLAYCRRSEPDIAIQRKLLAPQLSVWRRISSVGLPAATELTLMFLMMSVVYFVIRNEGASAQAGFGIGFRILSLLVLPVLAVSAAAAPIAGQSYGAENYPRVREVFRTTGVLSTAVMVVVAMLLLWQPQALLHFFETDVSSAEIAVSFLRLMSWTLIAEGLVYTCTSMFQALGNTMPALLSAIVRFVIFSLPAVWLSYQPAFHTDQVWLLLTASVAVQALVSLWLLQVEFKRKLQPVAIQANDQRTTRRTIASYEPSGGRIDPTKTV